MTDGPILFDVTGFDWAEDAPSVDLAPADRRTVP
jgi:hypothetical protein